MPYHHKTDFDSVVETSHDTPCQILQCSLNLPVFILSAAIICMQVEVCLAKAMRLKEVVEQADNTVASLTNVHLLFQ